MKTTRAEAIKLIGRVTGMVVIVHGQAKAVHASGDLGFYACASMS